jgi:hypothetical protein
MTFEQFYVGYQPWISLINLAIFISPILAAQVGRVSGTLYESHHRVSDLD